MQVSFISIFPEMIQANLKHGIVGRAVNRGDLSIEIVNPREHTSEQYRNIDDKPFGGGPGMVMMAEPLVRSVVAAKNLLTVDAPVILMSAQGAKFDHQLAFELSKLDAMILVSGRYEGVDQRFIDKEVDLEISVGDFVLSGGELAALVILDAVARLRTGILGNSDSINVESYVDGLLEFPHYTRPQELNLGDDEKTNKFKVVPPVLLSGDHARIARWRKKQTLLRTWQKRPDLLSGRKFSAEERELLLELIEAGQTP